MVSPNHLFPTSHRFADIDEIVERYLASHSSVRLWTTKLRLQLVRTTLFIHANYGISIKQDFKGEFFILIHCRGPDDLKVALVARAMLMRPFFAANHRSEESLHK